MASVDSPGQIVRDSVDCQRHPSTLWPHQAGDAFHQRALAIAVGAKQRDGLAASTWSVTPRSAFTAP